MRLAVLLLACALGLPGPVRARPVSALDLVRVRNGALAMGPVSLGATRREVERRLGRPIAVAPGAREGCGGGESEVLVRGRRVLVTWNGVAPDARAEHVLVILGDDELPTGIPGARSHLARRIRRLEPVVVTRHGPVEPTMAYLRLRTRPEHHVMVKRNGAWTLRVTLESCLD